MKNIYILFLLSLMILFGSSCKEPVNEQHDHPTELVTKKERVHLTLKQMEVMGIKTGNLQELNLNTTVKANGQLELPPQNKASVSSLMAGRVKSIAVIEGNYVIRGQVLARLEHPQYLKMQEDYLDIYSKWVFAQQEFERQAMLLADSIVSRKKYEEAVSKRNSFAGKLQAQKANLQLLGINTSALEKGNITANIPITSPINGFVRLVEVNMGQSVQPEQELFEIVDNEHIHIDLMVYEKDIDKVEEGQKVIFSLTSKPDQVFEGKVFSIGKAFENAPKAVSVHAEIENKTGNLLPGMYVDGRIETDQQKVNALPDEAVLSEGGLSYIFIQVDSPHTHNDDQGNEELEFKKIQVSTGMQDIGFTEVVPSQKLKPNTKIVTKGAFYLAAELKKDESGDGHGHSH